MEAILYSADVWRLGGLATVSVESRLYDVVDYVIACDAPLSLPGGEPFQRDSTCDEFFSINVDINFGNWQNTEMDKVFKALSDPTRRQILKLLREREMSAGQLADHFDISKPTMSGHFSVLKEAGLVDVERQGNVLLYRLKLSVLEEAMIPFMEFFGSTVSQQTRRSNK